MDKVELARLGLWLEPPSGLHSGVVWLSLVANLTPAHAAGNTHAPRLIQELPVARRCEDKRCHQEADGGGNRGLLWLFGNSLP